MYRGMQGSHLYTRVSVPITESSSRQIYFKSVRPNSFVGRVYERIQFRLWYRWNMYSNFSKQDFRAVAPQRYDTQEYLSATDSHQVLWRRLVLQARGMMPAEEAHQIQDTSAEEFSFERQQELGNAPERITTL